MPRASHPGVIILEAVAWQRLRDNEFRSCDSASPAVSAGTIPTETASPAAPSNTDMETEIVSASPMLALSTTNDLLSTSAWNRPLPPHGQVHFEAMSIDGHCRDVIGVRDLSASDTKRFDTRASRYYISLSAGVNAMAKKTSKKSAKVATKSAAKRVAAKADKPRNAVAKSSA